MEDVPPGWSVALVDNPGFGEDNQHIQQLAEVAMKTSSAYLYVVDSDALQDATDAKSFKLLYERDPGISSVTFCTPYQALHHNMLI